MRNEVCYNAAGGIFVNCQVVKEWVSYCICDKCIFNSGLIWSDCCEEYTSLKCNFVNSRENIEYVTD